MKGVNSLALRKVCISHHVSNSWMKSSRSMVFTAPEYLLGPFVAPYTSSISQSNGATIGGWEGVPTVDSSSESLSESPPLTTNNVVGRNCTPLRVNPVRRPSCSTASPEDSVMTLTKSATPMSPPSHQCRLYPNLSATAGVWATYPAITTRSLPRSAGHHSSLTVKET